VLQRHDRHEGNLTQYFSGDIGFRVKRRLLRILVLVWLGWYISGPACEAVDFWDSPREEMHDVMRSAGGAATLVAAIFCFGILLFRKWRERYSLLARALRGRFLPLAFLLPRFTLLTASSPSPSPPVPLRI
jgi:hypothetical protein